MGLVTAAATAPAAAAASSQQPAASFKAFFATCSAIYPKGGGL